MRSGVAIRVGEIEKQDRERGKIQSCDAMQMLRFGMTEIYKSFVALEKKILCKSSDRTMVERCCP